MVGVELFRRPVRQGRMQTHLIIIVAPAGQHSASLAQRREEHLVQAFVPEASIEALDERILLRLAWLYVMPIDAMRTTLGQDRHSGQFRAVVGKARRWLAALCNDSIKLARHASARERGVGHQA